MFKPVSPKADFPKLEEEILAFWEEKNIFEKSLKKTEKGERFVFYEGPPTANGKPHIGHVITRIFKDVFPRYKTMQGYYVLRKAGWDTHGLPVEVEVEKELGISGKEEIENLVKDDRKASIIKFNELCRKNVWKYIDEWEKMTKRVGNWIDLKNPYVTYKKEYIESVWWSLKELFDKGLLYLDYKVVPYCTRCETPLSSHEVAQDYKEVEDPSLFVKFPIENEKETYFLVWTTTPWTLPGNVGLAIDKNLSYVKVKHENEYLILGKEAAIRLGLNLIEKEYKGDDLLGKQYSPLFPFLKAKKENFKDLFTVLSGDFIKVDDGTGIVHTAVMYGEEDFELSKKYSLPKIHLVDQKGKFTKDVDKLSGIYIKKADKQIIEELQERKLIFKAETVLHQYPFCWRCHSPLIYYGLESWFIRTTSLKENLIANNEKVNWVPKHIKKGRMNNWYQTLIDWSLSRNRYWGTPLPIWTCVKCKKSTAIGSLEELKEKSKQKVDWENFDLHRPWVDEITIDCECGSEAKRVNFVIDVWYDSGCMPFAQFNYPIAKNDEFKSQFPADFISEAIDQTRGWFFSLQAISTMLFDKSPYKNVVVFSHALDKEGKKMSKHIGNVMDPSIALERFGADAIRWFFFSSVPVGTSYRVSEEQISEVVKRFILIYWNTYNFFISNALTEQWKLSDTENSNNVLDKWINSRLQSLILKVTKSMDEFDTFEATKDIERFIVEDFSKWFVRRSRDRMGYSSKDKEDKQAAFNTYFNVLISTTKILAPFIPFMSEEMFKNLSKEESVHLTDWPRCEKELIDEKLDAEMESARKLVELILSFRKENSFKVRTPIKVINYKGSLEISKEVSEVVLAEVNGYQLNYLGKAEEFEVEISKEEDNFDLEMGEARDIIRKIQDERKRMNAKVTQMITVTLAEWPEKHEEFIKARALISNLNKGTSFKVELDE